ncbi:hypothetical protein DVJ83_10795 [Deinococcus wulumuqiensis]|uniref:Uncharacterized protein n=1 Tax=Deinococcus wulumuqiensis TaxID=980427 RepID=A0A345IIK6_9DEIO|nr:hypothetical protein DVJ83_10795 [Deinococcus wulumuqiensis]
MTFKQHSANSALGWKLSLTSSPDTPFSTGGPCTGINRNPYNPYFFLLASARIESETTRFNRNPYNGKKREA